MLSGDAGGKNRQCILSWAVDAERGEAILQRMVDDAPHAAFYFSDLFATYRHLIYALGLYTPMSDKSETYRVKGDNAELRLTMPPLSSTPAHRFRF